jgi:ProP effector
VVEGIWRLQKHFPKAFPRKPEPKLPLKLGIHTDAMQQADKLGLTEAQIKDAIAAWCQGSRYWSCLVEHAVRVGLQGNPNGEVSAPQAARARWLASRRTRLHGGGKREREDTVADTTADAKTDAKADAKADPAVDAKADSTVDAKADAGHALGDAAVASVPALAPEESVQPSASPSSTA